MIQRYRQIGRVGHQVGLAAHQPAGLFDQLRVRVFLGHQLFGYSTASPGSSASGTAPLYGLQRGLDVVACRADLFQDLAELGFHVPIPFLVSAA
jgi:hypothetical protein